MRIFNKPIILFITISLLFFACNQKKEVEVKNQNLITDDLDSQFVFNNPPEKIVSLAPNLTEFLFELGLGSKIIGNTLYCNYPDSAKKIAKVADLLSVDLEKITILKPELIFITVEGNSKSEYEKLKDLGYRVFVSNPRNFEGVIKTYLDLGKIFGKEKQAIKQTVQWENRVQEIKTKTDSSSRKSGLLLVSLNPLFTIGSRSFIHEIMSFAGLENLAKDSPLSYPVFNREEVLLRNPDYIFLMNDNQKSKHEILKVYPEWKDVSAIKNDKVIFLDADLFSRPGPRFAEAVEYLHKKLSD